MKKIIFLIPLSFIGHCISAQDIVEQLTRAVGLISFSDKSQPGFSHFGTGSIITKALPNKTIAVFLVTNFHVLPQHNQCDSLTFQIRNSQSQNKSFIAIPVPIFDRNGVLSTRVKIAQNNIDVAAIYINPYISQPELDSIYTISYEMLCTRDSISKLNISLGEDIFYIGYPSIFYDNRNLSPILRTGIISTNPSEDFYFNSIYRNAYYQKTHQLIPEKFDGFLIDGNVLHGSSGSLVFLNSKKTKLETKATPNDVKLISTKLPIIILGIVSDTYTDLFDMSRANIGGVISGEYIKYTIDLFH